MVTRPGWKEQIRLARHPNVMIESGGITWLFNDEFYPFKGAVKAIREAADLVGMEKLMWGSDYPHAEGTFPFSKQVVDKLAADNPDVTTDELVAVLGGNAAKLFKRANLQAQVDARRAELMAAA